MAWLVLIYLYDKLLCQKPVPGRRTATRLHRLPGHQLRRIRLPAGGRLPNRHRHDPGGSRRSSGDSTDRIHPFFRQQPPNLRDLPPAPVIEALGTIAEAGRSCFPTASAWTIRISIDNSMKIIKFSTNLIARSIPTGTGLRARIKPRGESA